jgi:hypothetical protein
MTNESNPTRTATTARAELDALITHTDACDRTDPYRAEDAHDIAQEILRDYLIADSEDIDLDYYRDNYDPRDTNTDTDELAELIFELLSLIADDPYSTQYLSTMRLDYSICPMHHCDYMICFDDDDPECATIRAYFPDHDT